MGENLPKLSDDSSLSINIKWLIQIVIVVGGAVLLYTKLEKRIADLENETKSLQSSMKEQEIEMLNKA